MFVFFSLIVKVLGFLFGLCNDRGFSERLCSNDELVVEWLME